MASEAKYEVRVASVEVMAGSEGPVTLITKVPMSLWPLNAASDSRNPSVNEFSLDFRSFSFVPQTLSGRAIDFVSSIEVKTEFGSLIQDVKGSENVYGNPED